MHYVRRVHLLCYYRFEEYGELDEMLRKGGAVLMRPKLNEDFDDVDRWTPHKLTHDRTIICSSSPRRLCEDSKSWVW